MPQLVCLTTYRRHLRARWLRDFGPRLDTAIGEHLQRCLPYTLPEALYTSQRGHERNRSSWEYGEWRDNLGDTISRFVIPSLYPALCAQTWFDRRIYTRDDLLERCVREFILAPPAATPQPRPPC